LSMLLRQTGTVPRQTGRDVRTEREQPAGRRPGCEHVRTAQLHRRSETFVQRYRRPARRPALHFPTSFLPPLGTHQAARLRRTYRRCARAAGSSIDRCRALTSTTPTHSVPLRAALCAAAWAAGRCVPGFICCSYA
jgi:hypothetical protein